MKIPPFNVSTENQELVLQHTEKETCADSFPRLLIVDDELVNILLLANIFKCDHDVLFAKNGNDALRIALNEQPDLILLDIMMPEMTGYEVCRKLKLDPLTSDIPIIFISAMEGNGLSEVYGLELGAMDYIHKPFNPEIIKTRVHNQIELKRAYDAEKKAHVADLAIANEKLILQNAEKEKSAIELSRSRDENILLNCHVNHMQKLESIGRLTAGIAHDFNNVVACMLGYNEMNLFVSESLSDETLRAELEKNTKQIASAGQRAVSLIEKMMSYCRHSGIKERIDVKPTIEVINEVLEMLLPALTSQIRLEVALECDQIIQIDTIELHQIIVNLAVNARDAMKEFGGIITISLKTATNIKACCVACTAMIEGDFIKLSVSDNGTGIDPEIISQIFDPFFTTKKQGEGTGLGLFAVSGIVHRAGGHLLIDSNLNELNHGTTFRLLFPIFAEV